MKRLIWILIFLCAGAPLAFCQEVYQAATHVQLLAEQDTVKPGSTFWAGVDLTPDEGWHLYWQNPGDSGYPPQIKWDLPAGMKAGEIQWPYPDRLTLGPLTSFGYEHEILLLVPITVDANFQSPSNVKLHARVEWLTCKEMCVPGKADVDLPISVASDGQSFNSSKNAFDQARMNVPQVMNSISAMTVIKGDQLWLDVQTSSKSAGAIFFYPFRDDVIEHNLAQHTQLNANSYELSLTKSHLAQGVLKSLDGVLVNPNGWDQEGQIKAVIIHAPVGMPPVHISFFLACVCALIGGLILNLMPCVLPVLSIKVLHLIERHPDKSVALRHSMIYSLGVLASVWALATLLFVLKAAGQFAGWGFQFQSPIFVIIVALILFVLALNLFGVFEFSTPAISGLAGQEGYQASFISGVVTTIVASPCTAPFMGTALTAAISQPNVVGFEIFTCLGLGLALPFIVLSIFPSLLAFVPKPGMWMINLKRILGLVLITCVFWLLWVFSLETGLGNTLVQHQSSNQIQWQAYSDDAVSQARQTGKGVFIDFTAAWCINCQVNDRLVLQNSVVVNAFKEQGIVPFKADWTKYDPAITQALTSLGRDSIPVYVYYAPGADLPTILPQVITPQIVLDKIRHR